MKRIPLLLFAMTIFCSVSAQNSFTGIWEGKLNVGAGLRVVIHVDKNSDGKYSGKMDSPDQGAKDIPCSAVTVNGDSLIVEIKVAGAKYCGKMKDAQHINGGFMQGGMTIPLDLVKTEKVSEYKRPQTPQAPFDYISEDVIYKNADRSIQYGATITIPKGSGPFPAVVLITGSGLENRDEEIAQHKPFAVIADYLTKRGYIVLRVDDRGIGKSTGDVKHATSADFAKDVQVGIEYLRSRKEVNKKKIGLMGHSEGGMIAPMVAVERKDINFIVLLAGPGVKIAKVMEEQNRAMMESSGVSKEAIDAYLQLYGQLLHVVTSVQDSAAAYAKMLEAVKAWKGKTPAETVKLSTGITDAESEKEFAREFASIGSNEWYKYFLAYDPQPNLKRLSCKVLAINGSKDVQIIPGINLQGIRTCLAQSKTKVYEVKELPGLNHLFQTCKTCTVNEYAELEETFSPVALKTIADWMDKNLK